MIIKHIKRVKKTNILLLGLAYCWEN